MKFYVLHREQFVRASIIDVWNFFSNPRNLTLLTPGNMNFKIISPIKTNHIYKGMLIEYHLKPFGNFTIRWVTEITKIKKLEFFVDEQLEGPYKTWYHLHNFIPDNQGVWIIDDVKYTLPLDIIGRLFHNSLIKRRLNFIFNFRSSIIEKYFNKLQKL
ncbi:MAG: SRPBCC family protein [Ignavibacteria bacterium]